VIDQLVTVITEASIFAIMALGLNVVWGWSGDFDLAFYGYVAIGAYLTLALTIGPPSGSQQYILGQAWPFPVAVLLGTLSAMVLGLVVGAIALRHLRGIYFSIVTLGAVYVLSTFASQFVPLFNGYPGLSGLVDPMGDVLGIDYSNYQYFYLALCVVMLAIVLVGVTRLSSSRFGLALRTVREDERAAAVFGRDIYSLKLKAYVIGAGLGGFAGGLFAGYITAFNPSAWSPLETITLYAAVLVGGRGSTRGVILGVVVMVMGLQEATRYLPEVPGHPAWAPAFRLILTGVVLILFIRFRPQGILPERRMRDRNPPGSSGREAEAVAGPQPVTGPAFDPGTA
jgi:branched-chain amino acid transport system permease protein